MSPLVGRGEGPGQFRPAGGLAVSSTNEIFVADEHNKRIQVFSMKGGFLRSFPTGNMKPQAVCMGNNDTLWVASYPRRASDYGHAIQQYSKEGSVLAKFKCNDTRLCSIAWHKFSGRIILSLKKLSARAHLSTAWLSPTYTQTEATPWLTCDMTGFGSKGSKFVVPQFVTVDKNGNIFIADSIKNHVEKYDKNGVYLSSFGSKGTGAGNLYNPSGICVDSLGRVIVADTGNSRVEMFTAEGEHIRTIAYINQPTHVATGGEGQLVLTHGKFVTILPKY
ncbi:PREDICTED: E3 ubiquitin-protein ligase TRIM71-like [Branchiostoma belcheri]|uniref:E3 ubiquitin-protein ligase TRIM71-like n=1 Tax=Branchiostoma belcheri TaxID=7741 RepID=A0A6P4Y660_BRABE|nr:PREDICTED: E3 ubiquitin-protein ligase TRIM71-like [Branchiostoma belcheri]